MTTVTEPQHMQALGYANHIRCTQAHVLREIRSGERRITDVLTNPPPELASLKLSRLLDAQMRWGPKRTQRFCRQMVISEHRRLRDLTERQTRQLLEALRGV